MAEGDLQFDKAEFTGANAATTCTMCQQGLGTQYYELNGSVICGRCRSQILRERSEGSRAGRVVRATAFGLVAGAVGAAIWYGVRALTGYEVGLIAIVVGLMVGSAVRAGSNGRGGWAYQALAVFLTYASIVSNYVPDIVEAIRTQAGEETAALAGDATATGEAAVLDADAVEPPVTLTADASAPASPEAAEMSAGLGIVALAIAAVFLLAFAFAVPFMGGFENIIGILIIGFALYEAWKINRRTPFEITGPYRLATASRPPPTGA